MFEQLIESNHKKKSSLSQTVISLALHAGVIFGAVKATQGVVDGPKDVVVDTTMIFMKAPEAPPPPPPPPENVVVSANPPPQGFQVITPPDNIPTEIPPSKNGGLD